MTFSQARIIAVLTEKEEIFRKYATRTQAPESQRAFKECADECLKAIGTLKDAYEKEK